MAIQVILTFKYALRVLHNINKDKNSIVTQKGGKKIKREVRERERERKIEEREGRVSDQ